MRELRREGSYVPLIDAVNAEAVRREEYVLIEVWRNARTAGWAI